MRSLEITCTIMAVNQACFQSLIASPDPVMLDGGLGTSLISRGLPIGTLPEVWNLEHRGEVIAAHRAFIEAGAKVIMANTFGANRCRLQRAGLADNVEDVVAKGAECALEAAGSETIVALSIGPTGEFVEPFGTLTRAEIEAIFQEQAAAGLRCGVEIAWLETMLDLTEAICAVNGARAAGYEQICATFTFQKSPQGPRTAMGTTPRDIAQELVAAGVLVMGANCGAGPEDALAACREMAQAVEGATLIAKPNAGVPVLRDGVPEYPLSPSQFAEELTVGLALGVKLYGGCCGTTASHLRELKAGLEGIRQVGRHRS